MNVTSVHVATDEMDGWMSSDESSGCFSCLAHRGR